MTEQYQSVISAVDTQSLQTIIDSIPIGTLIIGKQGVFIDCNKETLRIFDASDRNEIIGKQPSILSPLKQKNGSDTAFEVERLINKAFSTGSVSFYWEHMTLKMKQFPARVTLKPILYNGEQCLLTTVIDMSKQVRIEENKALINQNPYALLKLNPDLTIAEVNPAFTKISGYRWEDWIGKTLADFKTIKREGLTVEDAVKSKSIVSGTVVVDFPTGIKNMEYSYIPVFDSEGNLIIIYDIFADLTELVQRINESDALVKENPASIITMDTQGNILAVNPSFLDLCKLPEKQLLSMKIQEFNITKREGQSFGDVLTLKKPGKGRLVVDFGWAVKTLDFTYIPIIDVNGNVVNVVAMYIDISEQVAYIDEIQTFIQENPNAILMVDTDQHIRDNNPAFEKILGYTHEESLKMKLSDINVTERVGPTIREALETKKAARGRMVVDSPKGVKNLDYVYIPITNQKGDVIRFIEIFSDMTEIRSLLSYLERSVELVQQNIRSLANGNTTFSVEILEADEHSAQAREQFVKIGQAVETARQAITSLVSDSDAIAKAAIAGNIQYRSDPSIHEGDYRTIIEGMNQTLDSITAPVYESMKIAEAYANYNFAIRFDQKIEVKGEWIQFRNALNNIGIKVSEAVSLINKNISDLATRAEQANVSIEEVITGAQQIATNTGKVSQNSEQGGDGISQVLRAMEDLNETVGAVSRKAESVSVSSNQANELAKGGITLAHRSEKAMGDITLSTEEVDSIVSGINSEMDEIGKIVRLISDIASQTNLLALNAAIEAARAGDAGRGFAVVASEVKSLALDSRKSAETIDDIITKLQARAKQATEAMEKSTTAVMEGSNALEETLTAFNRIADTIGEINNNTVEVASASEEQAASVEEVTASIQEVANLIQNTSQEAGDAAAASQEASASIDEIGQIMSGVVGIVENVSGEMAKFKI
ncbi:methyl-accepting chemotaxis protein [Methanospirillum lacunae]|nr:methyl-accepting chemotaxis protein [Methanospirillum lacunae]